MRDLGREGGAPQQLRQDVELDRGLPSIYIELLCCGRLVNQLLEEEFKRGLHALSIQAKTPEQWERSNHAIQPSPPCLGGGTTTRQ